MQLNSLKIGDKIARLPIIQGGMGVGASLRAIKKHLIRAAVETGADVVICGAGLPLDLPELVEGSDTKISPIVSSARACKLILK